MANNQLKWGIVYKTSQYTGDDEHIIMNGLNLSQKLIIKNKFY